MFGRKLPAFSSRAEAEAHLFSERDERLRPIDGLSPSSGVFVANDTPESLKHLERWYLDRCDSDGFGVHGLSREEFECCISRRSVKTKFSSECGTETLTICLPQAHAREFRAKTRAARTNPSEVLRQTAARYVREDPTARRAIVEHLSSRAGTWAGAISGEELLRRTRP